VGALDLDCFQLGIIDNEVVALGDLVAAAFIFGATGARVPSSIS
jgi:hypothetical protein